MRRAIRSGELTATKQGGSFHIPPESLERYRERRARPVQHRSGPRLPALPASPTSFIGREAVVAEVTALLRRHDVRLLTLTGPVGTGKTRLALRVAADLAARFADGVAFVPLASFHQSDLVIPTIAQVLGVRETEDQPLRERLRAVLRDRDVLLVLDNLEQIPQAAPSLGDLLATCPGLTILATSRAPLHLAGERVYPVPPLALPLRRATVAGETELPPLAEVARIEGIQLFTERATAVSADFTLTAENAPAIAAICERVAGIPLAIELAAARTRVLTPDDLLARLSPQLPLLAGGPADQPPRLRSMADAIAWSHDLLSPAEQTLFRRLAVFVGGFTLEAAERVGGRGAEGGAALRGAAATRPEGGEEHEGGDHSTTSSPYPPLSKATPLEPKATLLFPPSPLSVLDALTALVDQSLVQRVLGPGNQTRFAMLEPVREYGLARLAASGEEAIVRDAHADWCLGFAVRAEPELAGPDQHAWFDRLQAEHPNMRVALGWLQQHGDGERGLQLASTLSWFWSSRGYLREAREWLETFLSMTTSAATRALGLLEAVTILQWLGENERALVLNGEALGFFRELGDQRRAAAALRQRASIAIDRGDHAQAAAFLTESSDVFQGVGTAWDGAFALYLAGRVAAVAGKSTEATSRLAAAADAFREVGDYGYVAAALARQGAAAIESGEIETARGAYAAALSLAHERNEPIWVASALAGAAHVANTTNDPTTAACLLGASAAIREAIGEGVEPDETLIDEVRRALGEGRFTAWQRHGSHLAESEAIAEAQAVLSGSIWSRRSRSPGQEWERHSRPLTIREKDVLRLLVNGLADKEIAAVLGISRATVSDHMTAIRAKLGVPSRAAAAALAVRNGLLSS